MIEREGTEMPQPRLAKRQPQREQPITAQYGRNAIEHAASGGTVPSVDQSPDFLLLVAEATRAAILERVDNLGSCIATTRVLIDVFHRFGIRANPALYSVVVLNPQLTQRMRAEGRIIRPDELRPGEAARTLERAKHRASMDAHLVAHVADSFLVDASADQFKDPDAGIALTPLVIPLTLERRRRGLIGYTAPDDISIVYRARGDTPYRRAPDWTNRRWAGMVATTVEARLRAQGHG